MAQDRLQAAAGAPTGVAALATVRQELLDPLLRQVPGSRPVSSSQRLRWAITRSRLQLDSGAYPWANNSTRDCCGDVRGDLSVGHEMGPCFLTFPAFLPGEEASHPTFGLCRLHEAWVPREPAPREEPTRHNPLLGIMPAAPPRGARGGIPGDVGHRRHGALLPARRPAAPGRPAGPALGRSAARTDVCSPSWKSGCIRPAMHPPWLRCFSFEYSRHAHSSSCLARGAPRRPRCDAGLPRRTAGQARCRRHHDRSAGRAAPLARRAAGRVLGDRRPLEAANDGDEPGGRWRVASRTRAMSRMAGEPLASRVSEHWQRVQQPQN